MQLVDSAQTTAKKSLNVYGRRMRCGRQKSIRRIFNDWWHGKIQSCRRTLFRILPARKPCWISGFVMPRLRLTLAYAGTNYKGWQRQLQGEVELPTVQGVVEKEISRICDTKISLQGSEEPIRACMPTAKSPIAIFRKTKRGLIGSWRSIPLCPMIYVSKNMRLSPIPSMPFMMLKKSLYV